MCSNKNSSLNGMLQKAEVRRSMRIVQTLCFEIFRILDDTKGGRSSLTLPEIVQLINQPLSPRLNALVRGLVNSEYLDEQEIENQCKYRLHQEKCYKPSLPLPYYVSATYPDEDNSN
jgi:hypothetical protein